MSMNHVRVKHWKYPELREAINSSTDIVLLQACVSELTRRLDAYRYWKSKNTILLKHHKEEDKEHSTNSTIHLDMAAEHRNMEFEELMQRITTSNNLNEIHACQKELQNRLNSYVAIKESVLIKGKKPNSTKTNNQNVPSKSTTAHSSERRPSNIPVHSKRCFKTPLVNEYGEYSGLWYGQFDNQNIMKQMELREHQPPVFLRAGYDDKLMCSFPLSDTGLEKVKGAEISYEEFAKTWNSLGGKPIIFM